MNENARPQCVRVSPSEQRALVLKQGKEVTPVAEVCRKAGISHATSFNGKKRCGSPLPDELRGLKAREDENNRLTKVVVDLTLVREMLQGASSPESAFASRLEPVALAGSPCLDTAIGRWDVGGPGRAGPSGSSGVMAPGQATPLWPTAEQRTRTERQICRDPRGPCLRNNRTERSTFNRSCVMMPPRVLSSSCSAV